MKISLSAFLAVVPLFFALDALSQSRPILDGVISDQGVFAVSISVWGKDAEALSRKLKRVSVTTPDRFTVNLIGSLSNGRIIEVLPGGLRMSSSRNFSAIAIFSVGLFDYVSARPSQSTLTWTSTLAALFENIWDPNTAERASGAPLTLSGNGPLVSDALDSLNGRYKTIQDLEKENLVELILSDANPIESLSDRRRLVGFFWDKNERRLIRVEEPAQRLQDDFDSKSRWADAISVKEWRLWGDPSKSHYWVESPERRLKPDEILTSTGEIYPEPAVKALQLSDGSFLVIRDWYGKGEQEASLGSHLRAHLLGGYDLPPTLHNKPFLLSKIDRGGEVAIVAREVERLQANDVSRLDPGLEAKRPPMVLNLGGIQSLASELLRRAQFERTAKEASSQGQSQRRSLQSRASCVSAFGI